VAARPQSSLSRASVLGLAAAVLATHAYALWGASFGAPSHMAGRHTAWSAPVTSTTPLVQTFWSEVDGLDSASFYARPAAGLGARSVALALVDPATGGRLVEATVPLDAPPEGRWIDWTFPPVDGNRQRPLVFEIGVPPGDPGGVQFEVTPDPGAYIAGRLYVGPREQWADLRFRTTAVRSNPWAGLTHGLGRDWPSGHALLAFVATLAVVLASLLVFLCGLTEAVRWPTQPKLPL